MASLIIGFGVAALTSSGGAAAGLTGWAALGFGAAAVAAQIGAAYIDQTYIYPLFKGDQEVRGPRIDDRGIQTASEGSPLRTCYGAENRVAGTVIWLSKLLEYEIKRDMGGGKGGGSDPEAITYDYYYHVAVAICEGPISRIKKIWADAKVLYDVDVSVQQDPQIHKLRFHLGTTTQMPDVLIQAEEGEENTPAFRHTAYVVMEGLFLQNFGNRLPQFSFMVEVEEHSSVAGVIQQICERAGMAEEQIVTEMDKSVRGYTTSGPTTAITSLEPIMQAYRVLTQETGESIRFFPRGFETIINVDKKDLVAKEGGQTSESRPFTLSDPSGFTLPKEVNVRYTDPTSEYQSGLTRYARNDTNSIQTVQFDLPIVMTAKDARNFAAQWLWRSFSERMLMELALPPKYLKIQENDVLRFEWGTETYMVRVAQADFGLNGLINIKGLLVDQSDADEDVDCGPHRIIDDDDSLAIPSANMVFSVMDTPAVRDEDVDQVGLYYGVSAPFAQTYFNGASVYQSTDGINWLFLSRIKAEATYGVTTNTLGDGEANIWDYENSVEVQLFRGSLESQAESVVLNGANRMWVGKELIAFKDVELIGPMKYRLTNLLRGLRVTPMTYHGENERVVLLNPDNVFFQPLNAAQVGSERYYKVIQPGQELDDVAAFTALFDGATMKQLPPCQLGITRDLVTGDVTVTWHRRTRSLVKAFASVKPLNADSEQYQLEWWDVDSTTLLAKTKYRTVVVNGPPSTTLLGPPFSATYLYTDRIADGFLGSIMTRVIVRIYQMGPTGRGFPAEILLP